MTSIDQLGSAPAAGLGSHPTGQDTTKGTPAVMAGYARELARALDEEDAESLAEFLDLPHLIYWKDSRGDYLGANGAYLSARGLGEFDDPVGLPEEELPIQDALSGFLPPLERQVIGSGMPVMREESFGVEPRCHRILWTLHPLAGTNGLARGVLAIGADVTGIAETHLEPADTESPTTGLLEIIAEQIDGPVQAMVNQTRFLVETINRTLTTLGRIAELAEPAGPNGDGPDDPVAAMAAVAAAIAELNLDDLRTDLPTTLLHSLVGLSQISSNVSVLKTFGRSSSQWVALDLNQAIEQAIDLTRSRWDPVADLQLKLDPKVGLISCVEGELRRVVLNLILNSVQALDIRREREPGFVGGLIEISTTSAMGLATVRVRDNGSSLDRGHRLRLAEDLNGQGSPVEEGGASLAAVLSRHGGQIALTIDPDHGAETQVTLPELPRSA